MATDALNTSQPQQPQPVYTEPIDASTIRYEAHDGLASSLPAADSAPPAAQYEAHDGITSLPSAATHGLQMLQAASDPISAQQFAQSASLQVDNQQYGASLPIMSNLPPATATSNGSPAAASGAPKVTRLRRACDMCSSRKVKCDESGPPCKPCRDLNVECTFQREMKRRGPPNKHAEAAKASKRARTEENVSPTPHNAAAALVSIAGHNESSGATTVLDVEAIAPWPVLMLLIDDFFTYMHPLMPFPHEPSFRARLLNREDRTNREFLALTASMIGTLVASFPRSARSHLKASQSTDLFPTAITLIDRCRLVAVEARGSTYMAKDEMTVDDTATSYFLGLAAAYTMQEKLCMRYLSETMAFCRELGIYRSRVANGVTSPSAQIDHIKDQIGKRIFWVMVVGLRSMTQFGVSNNSIPLPPPTAQEPYPDLPLEVDDDYIFTDQVFPQPEGSLPLISGFIRNINTYMSMNELVGVDMCYGINFFEWSAQKTMLKNALQAAKGVTDGLPSELQVRTESDQNDGGSVAPYDSSLQYCPPAFPAPQPENDVRHAFVQDPYRRRKLQFEIQKANIYASQLATRSYFVERYLNLRDAHRSHTNFPENGEGEIKDETDVMVINERELIVENLLTVLTSITQHNMEPNGASLVNKVRQVASTLLNDTPERKGPVAMKAEQDLGKFLDILMKLGKSGTSAGATDTMTAQDEEEELQHWASLRDYQIQFAASGDNVSQA